MENTHMYNVPMENTHVENAHVDNAHLEKYHHYKGKVDHHLAKMNKYKGVSKSDFMLHYKKYKIYYAKMMHYHQMCMAAPKKVCETHKYYKHYYHHEHIDVHTHKCIKGGHCGY